MEECNIGMVTSIVAIVISIVSLLVSIAQFFYKIKEDKKKSIDELSKELTKLLEYTIQYPYLEHPSITKTWKENRASQDEKYMRYDQFCNILFNFLSKLFSYFDGDAKKVEDFVDIKTWVRLHRQIWEYPADENENVDAYSKEFRSFINSYLK